MTYYVYKVHIKQEKEAQMPPETGKTAANEENISINDMHLLGTKLCYTLVIG